MLGLLYPEWVFICTQVNEEAEAAGELRDNIKKMREDKERLEKHNESIETALQEANSLLNEKAASINILNNKVTCLYCWQKEVCNIAYRWICNVQILIGGLKTQNFYKQRL